MRRLPLDRRRKHGESLEQLNGISEGLATSIKALYQVGHAAGGVPTRNGIDRLFRQLVFSVSGIRKFFLASTAGGPASRWFYGATIYH